MKNTIYRILLLSILLPMLSCSDDVYVDGDWKFSIETSDSSVRIAEDGNSAEITLSGEGSTAEFNVVANDNITWELLTTNTEEWCKVERNENTILVSAAEFGSEYRRQTYFTLTSQYGQTITLFVKQAGTDAPTLKLSPDYVWYFTEIGGRKTVKVETNMDDWDVVGYEDVEWLNVEKGDKSFELIANRNKKEEELSVDLIVTVGRGENTYSEVFEVVLEAMTPAFIVVDTGNSSTIAIPAEGGKTSAMPVYTNIDDWTAIADDEWLTIEKTDNSVTFSAPASSEPRSTAVTFTAQDEGGNVATAIVKVRQIGGSLKLQIEVPANGTFKPNTTGTGINIKVDWGDGSEIESFTDASNLKHRYTAAGTYEIAISGYVPELDASIMDNNSKSYLKAVTGWGDLATSSMASAFEGTDISSLAPGAEIMMASVETFLNAFKNCKKLTVESIPEDLFKGATRAKNFNNLFSNCTLLTTVPAGLFDDCNGADADFDQNDDAQETVSVSFNTLFYMSGVTNIPAGLFDKLTNMTSASGMFRNSKIQSIPNKLFANNSRLDDLSYAFASCSSLSTIPADLLEGASELSIVTSTFSYSNITTIPENLFANCPKLKNISSCFDGCSKIVSIPAKLFEKNTEISWARTVFNGTGITTVPGQLFKNCPMLIDVTGMFWNASSLQTIEEGLFDGCSDILNAGNLFWNCSALTSVPENLFDSARNLRGFENMFNGCSKLTGESPYSMVDGKKVHFYERPDYPSVFFTDSGFSFTSCFRNAKNLSDYNQIPSGWK